MFLEFLAAENLKTRFPPRSVAGWGIGARQFRAGIALLEFLAGHRVPPFRAGIVFLEFLAAENLKNTIPAPLCRGMGHRVPPIPSGNRLFGIFSCRKPQKHDSRPFCGGV